ncbi:InlB B-repeat-containing protein [Opitutales bacterium]|nr:InlB B-repeat-containing protein [Opitutales bacterium]
MGLLITVSGYFLFKQTEKRIVQQTVSASSKVTKGPVSFEQKLESSSTIPSVPKLRNAPVVQAGKANFEKEIWCSVMEYKDLSADPIFDEFLKWLSDYKDLHCRQPGNCQEHDPRILSNHLIRGERLARARARTLSEVIRGDPKRALQLAVSSEIIGSLPTTISSHMEKWESDFADITSMHHCFDSEQPGGWIKTVATLSGGQNLRAWTFGKRKRLLTQKGLAVWGISLGNDFAMSENAFRVMEIGTEGGKLFFAQGDVAYKTAQQREFLVTHLRPSTRRVGGIKHLKYPLVMGSGSTIDKILAQKYEINSTKVTFQQAVDAAIERNASLLKIDNANENALITTLLKEAYEDETLFKGLDETNNSKTYVWLGATDNEDINGTRFNTDTNTSVQDVDINATEGDWKWLQGNGESITYHNWKWGSNPADAPDNATKDFAAMDWNATGATWLDINETARLPFIIERDFEIGTQEVDLMGIRKVLVIPARFIDETTAYGSALGGSNNPLTNELGESILEELQTDSYEPITKQKIESAMTEVSEFFSRNTDEQLEIVPVISSTVTLDLLRYSPDFSSPTGVNPYDSEGTLSGIIEITEGDTRITLSQDPGDFHRAINLQALSKAAALSDEWNHEGSAFIGVASVTINNGTLGTNFSKPPSVEIIGGEDLLANGSPHPRFRQAKLEAVIDESGDILGFNVLEPGAFYANAQDANITINGTDFTSQLTINIQGLLVSYVILTNYSGNAPGVGFVGGPGAHVRLGGAEVPTSIIVHEMGHNLGLLHANRYFTRSERPLSDDADQIEYGNSFSVMGTQDNIATSGDLTIAAKVGLTNTMSNGGYTVGTSIGDDVAEIDAASLGGNELDDLKESNVETNNTFRIYRSNFGRPPAGLRVGTFFIDLPADADGNYTLDKNAFPFAINIVGTGEDVNGSLNYNSISDIWTLNITKAGRGFVEEPSIQIMDENGSMILMLNPSNILELRGTDNLTQATLLDPTTRWIRGIRAQTPSTASIKPHSMLTGEELLDYYLSYRTDISTDGLVINVATHSDDGPIEPFLLDTTPQTPFNYNDGALLLGKTYSDYNADLHFTPIRTGGHELIPYIEVVVNAGSVARNEAEVPDFNLSATSTSPLPGEYVQFSVMIDGNASNFAYSWFLNEQSLSSSTYLNSSSIYLNFNELGTQVLRVVVSDMKGGIASRNLILKVGDGNTINQSMVTGTVRSRQNPVQGARVVLSESPIIEHKVSWAGNLYDSFFPASGGSPGQFMINGEVAPELNFHRGEIHRFTFDSTMDGVDMSFLQGIENRPPEIILNMLLDARMDLTKGSGYVRNPKVYYTFGSTFSNYRTNDVGTYLDMLEYLQDHQNMTKSLPSTELNATADGNATVLDLLEYLEANSSLVSFDDFNNTTHTNLISRPYAKALVQETSINYARVGPREINEFGDFLAYGGRGYDRNNTPVIEVRRASIWEDYSNSDANITAYVDGVGTISPVIATSFLGNTWKSRPGDSISPSLVVWGSGATDNSDPYAEVNATVTNWMSGSEQMRTISISNQGKGFEPNSTMAVLHYPHEPFAYWSFDRHESLFEDVSEARHQPSPGWNLEPDSQNLEHYWKLDENLSGGSPNEVNASASLLASQTLDENDFNNWGLMGNSLEINSTNLLSAVRVLDENFTLSMWINPQGDFQVVFSGSDSIQFSNSDSSYELNPPLNNDTNLTAKGENNWTHLGIICNQGSATLFVDGRAANSPASVSAVDLNISAVQSVLVDEVKVYGVPLSDAEMRYLSGRTYLDISGNKYHATPMGSADFLPVSPETVNAGDDKVPEFTPYPNSPNGTGRLGDSFAGELNGLSLNFDGAEDHLDLSTHALEFGLAEGTFSLWVKTSSSKSPNPLFWSSSPPVIDVFTDVETNQTEITITPGSFFALELSNGLPRLAGLGANNPGNRVNDGEWHHIAASFPGSQIWIDGENIQVSPYDLADSLYDGFDNLFAFSADAKTLNIGKAMDRTVRDTEIFFNGRIDDFIVYNKILTNEEVQYLFELRRGREQVPRLEAVVDAVGTVKINETGAGYRENPEFVFWYGSEENKTDLPSFPNLTGLEGNFTESNGTHGQLAYVVDEDAVYNFHQGTNSTKRSGYIWRDGSDNGWRRLIDAEGIGEFESASVGEIVWVKKMDTVTTLPMPDGRMVDRLYVDYITMNQNRSTRLELNASFPWPHPYHQPQGLFGFDEAIVFSVSDPTLHNPLAIESPTAEAFAFYFLDPDINETVSIVDGGHGITSIPFDQVRINGSGYQPATANQKEEEHLGHADIDTWFGHPTLKNTPLSQYFGVYDWNGSEDVNISLIDFNRTFSSVSVNNPGYGYSMPVELKVIGGFPQQTNAILNLQEYNQSVPYLISEAILEVNEINPETGAIIDVSIISGGSGYVNYQNTDPQEYPFTIYPMVTVSGGGGRGAIIQAVDNNNDGTIDDTNILDGGIGYFNWKPDNRPTAKHSDFTMSADEKNATLEVRLGGYLQEIPRCTMCAQGAPGGHDKAGTSAEFSHLEPWIEIWDRGRKEEDIDAAGERAHGAPKVVNGEINKVVVTKSGRGYVDPVAIVRDVGPKHIGYHDSADSFHRKWKCMFLRMTEDGRKVECGHVHVGMYPPEECPGETDAQFPYQDENGTLITPTGDQITGWRIRHDANHKDCSLTENPAHLDTLFLARKCWGTKVSYQLHDNAYYRNPYSDWLPMDANLSVICENGKILEIVVEDNGSNYYASQIYVEGSGTGVDAFPVFDEYGLNTSVILDDPKLKNLELDKIYRPKGAGQGFQERSWAWDETGNSLFTVTRDGDPETFPNDPLSGDPQERVRVVVRHSEDTPNLNSIWHLGTPILADHQGDRIFSVEVTEPGLYSATRDLSEVSIEFNGSVALDQDFNGTSDFIAAEVTGLSTSRMTRLVLDDNASYEDNSSGTVIERGLFDERPSAQFLDGRNLSNLTNFGYELETPSDYIRLNNVVDYDPDPKKSFIELYIDDRFPAQLYYGNGVTTTTSQTVPAFGNRILISDPVPGSSWAINEPLTKRQYSYTDQNGQYAFGNLDPGMYNVSVFLEDIKLQESSFRPQADPYRISQVLYVPGFPELTLETDNLGRGISSLIWTLESRNLARPSAQLNAEDEFLQEFYNKRLEGIGRGFDPAGDPPELIFIPDPDNLSTSKPNLTVAINVDGSLTLQIVDDDNTTVFFPGDRFTIIYNNSISGVDFFESYYFSESNSTINYGSGGSQALGAPSLFLFPDDGGGLNPLEVPLSTNFRGDQPFNLNALVYDANGSIITPTPQIDWNITLDFNASDGNNSRVAQFEDSLGNRDLNASGEQVKFFLYSTLRKGVGSINGFNILAGGENYALGDRLRFSEGYGFDANITDINSTNGAITGIQLNHRGFGISESAVLSIWDANYSSLSAGIGAVIKPVFPSGVLVLDVNTTLATGITLSKQLRVRPSNSNFLNSREKWLNQYLDSFMEKDALWWNLQGNHLEYTHQDEMNAGTNPLALDTDLDGRNDINESTVNPSGFTSNPLIYDTDADGWSDDKENTEGTNPRSKDTDGDGLFDPEDLDPLNSSGDGIISGRIFKKSVYGDKQLFFRYAAPANINSTQWKSSWTGEPASFYLSGLTDGTYTIQAFVNWDGSVDNSYTYGEPIAEHNVTLANGVNVYGVSLIPIDPDPILYFKNPPSSFPNNGITVVNDKLTDINDTQFRHLEQNITVESNASNAQNLSEFEWGIRGSDPFYVGSYNNLNSIRDVWFEILEQDSNFTTYLNSPYGNSTARFDLSSIPVGKYSLTYTARDEFYNYAEETLTQNIEIRDAQAPYLSLLFQGGGVTTLPDSLPEADGLLNSNSSAVLEWNVTEQLRLSDQFADDAEVLIQLFDLKNHFENDFENDNQQDWNVTVSFSTSYDYNYTNVSDIEALSLTYGIPVIHDEYFELNTTNLGTYKLEFIVSDQAGNELDFSLYILVKPGVVSEITAVDGYLSNATVIFDADGDGISDLNRKFYTNEYGKAQIILSQRELEAFDLNSNGKLDSDEGKFIVIGGIDTSTGTKFSGKLVADANASVVSPLTTMISKMMDLGASKQEALTALSLALELDSSIDLTNYDPIQRAFEGDERAASVMMANLRMANLVNQAEGLLLALSEDYQGYEVGSNLLEEIAKGLPTQATSGSLDLESALVDALPIALASVGTAGELSLEDQLAMFQLMADLDQSISNFSDGEDFSSLMLRQKEIILDLENLFDGIDEEGLDLRSHQLLINYETGGTAGGSGIYPYGSKVTIFANAEEGYAFNGWTGDGASEANASSTFVVMTRDHNLTAQFTLQTYEVSVLVPSGGTVTGAGSYQHGETANLIATANTGSEFIGWSRNGIDLGSTANYSTLVDQDLFLVARFTQATPLLELLPETGGRVVGEGSYALGETVHIQAFADEGYVFSGWSGAGAYDANSSSTIVEMNENRSLTATFVLQPAETYSLELESSPSQGGRTSGTGAYSYGETINISAVSLPGYVFEEWIGQGMVNPNEPNTSVVLSGNFYLFAKFKPLEYQITVQSTTGGVALGGGKYPFSSSVNLTAVPAIGHRFVGWKGTGITDPSDQNLVVKVEENRTYDAVFEPMSHNLKIITSSGGLVIGGGNFSHGSTVQVEAIPATGYRFDGWLGEAIINKEVITTTLLLTEDTIIEASFVLAENYFTPRAENFVLEIDRTDFQPLETIYTIAGEDGDGDAITYQLISGNLDKDEDGIPLFELQTNGSLLMLDPDEIFLSAGATIPLKILLQDTGGKSSEIQATVHIQNSFVFNSTSLGSGWYESDWFGVFLSKDNTWVYHRRLGWLYVQSIDLESYWIWDPILEDWLWTDETFFPWTYSNFYSSWYYFNLESEKVRFFDHNLQKWKLRP